MQGKREKTENHKIEEKGFVEAGSNGNTKTDVGAATITDAASEERSSAMSNRSYENRHRRNHSLADRGPQFAINPRIDKAGGILNLIFRKFYRQHARVQRLTTPDRVRVMACCT